MPNVEELLSAVKEAGRKKSQDADNSYRLAVLSVATGTEDDAAGVAAVIEAAGKTPDAFEADVKRLRTRQDLCAKIEEAEALVPELDAVREKIAAADAKLDAAKLAHRKATEPLNQEATSLQYRISLAVGFRRQLMETADPELRARIKAAEKQIESLTPEIGAVQAEVAKLERESRLPTDGVCDPSFAPRARQALPAALAKRESLLAKRDAIRAEIASVREAMLLP